MRTTLTIDDDVLAFAKAVAQQEDRTIGEVLSTLARAGMHPVTREPVEMRNGVQLSPRRRAGAVVTLEMVNALRDEIP